MTEEIFPTFHGIVRAPTSTPQGIWTRFIVSPSKGERLVATPFKCCHIRRPSLMHACKYVKLAASAYLITKSDLPIFHCCFSFCKELRIDRVFFLRMYKRVHCNVVAIESAPARIWSTNSDSHSCCVTPCATRSRACLGSGPKRSATTFCAMRTRVPKPILSSGLYVSGL